MGSPLDDQKGRKGGEARSVKPRPQLLAYAPRICGTRPFAAREPSGRNPQARCEMAWFIFIH